MGLEMEERPVACGQAGERVDIADHSVDGPGRHASAPAPRVGQTSGLCSDTRRSSLYGGFERTRGSTHGPSHILVRPLWRLGGYACHHRGCVIRRSRTSAGGSARAGITLGDRRSRSGGSWDCLEPRLWSTPASRAALLPSRAPAPSLRPLLRPLQSRLPAADLTTCARPERMSLGSLTTGRSRTSIRAMADRERAPPRCRQRQGRRWPRSRHVRRPSSRTRGNGPPQIWGRLLLGPLSFILVTASATVSLARVAASATD